MTTPTKPLLYRGVLLTESDYIDISDDHSLPLDIVKEVVAQIRELGKPQYEMYSGTLRSKVEQFAKQVGEEAVVVAQKEEVEAKDEAAGHMLARLIEPMDDHFILQPDGTARINRQAPPSIEKSYEVLAQAIKMDSLTDRVKDFSSWLLGSLVVEMEAFFGDDFSVSQVCETTEKAYNTVHTAVDVFKMFKGKRVTGLTFTHHKEVTYPMTDDEKFPIDEKIKVLKFAKGRGLTARDTRDVASYFKINQTIDPLKKTTTPKKLKELLSAHRQGKVQYLIFDGTSWTRKNIRGAMVPTGKTVINLKTFMVKRNEGKEEEIPLTKEAKA